MFVALSGHHQLSEGLRYFLEEFIYAHLGEGYFFEEYRQDHRDIGWNITLELNLRLTGASKTLIITKETGFQGTYFADFMNSISSLIREINIGQDKDYQIINALSGSDAQNILRY